MKVPRRLLLSLPLLLPAAASAQTASSQAARITAGKAAITAANSARWAEADTYAAAADPLVAKIVLWMRLTHRTAPASAGELVGFLRDNPDWPQPDSIARRAETAFGGPADDALALAHFTTYPPRSLTGALRHAEALIRGTRSQQRAGSVQDLARRGPDFARVSPISPGAEANTAGPDEAAAQSTLRRACLEEQWYDVKYESIMSYFV
jgi:soluble lytic murein transglycosylase